MSTMSSSLPSIVVDLVKGAAEGRHLSRACHDRLVGASREERCSASALSSLYQTRGVSATLRLPNSSYAALSSLYQTRGVPATLTLPSAARLHSAAYIKREAWQPRSGCHQQLGCTQQPISNARCVSHAQAAISS